MIKRILVGLEGTPYTRVAVRTAVELARQHGARVTGVTVLDRRRLMDVGPVPPAAGEAAKELREYRVHVTEQHMIEAIERFEQDCTAADVDHAVRQETGDAFELICSLARYHDIMAFGLRSLFDYGLNLQPDDVLKRLIRSGVRPILAVAEHYRPVRRVLMAYSGSLASAKTIKRFLQSSLWPEMAVCILTCEHEEANARELLENMAEYCRDHGIDPEVAYSVQPARSYIIQYAAEWDADLIVLANGAHNLLARKIWGDTVLDVIRHSDRALYLSQ